MLYIVRGLPGSGKSTLARKLIAQGAAESYWEADMYFMVRGQYRYNPAQISEAHEWCRRQVFTDLANGKSVVVSNTFTRMFEMKDYIGYAKAKGIPFKVIRLTAQYGSIHHVPLAAIERMRVRWEDYDGEEVV